MDETRVTTILAIGVLAYAARVLPQVLFCREAISRSLGSFFTLSILFLYLRHHLHYSLCDGCSLRQCGSAASGCGFGPCDLCGASN